MVLFYQANADPKIIASKIYKTMMITKLLFLGREQQLVDTVWLFEQDIKTPPFRILDIGTYNND